MLPAFAIQCLQLVPAPTSPRGSPQRQKLGHQGRSRKSIRLAPGRPLPAFRVSPSPPASPHCPDCAPPADSPSRSNVSAPVSAPNSPPSSPSATRRQATWEAYFEELLHFASEHGHSSVPRDSKRYEYLYRWVRTQRHEWKRGKLSDEKFRRLSSVAGFTWDAHFEVWKANFFKLVDFHNIHGHCSVPLRDGDGEDYRRLARWVAKQRHFAKRGVLDDDRRRRLQGLGFSFSGVDVHFDQRLAQLRDLKARYGHANLPPSWPDDPSLARWAETTRRRWRQGKLEQDKQRVLAGVGFTLAPTANAEWDAHYSALVSFVKRNKLALPTFIDDAPLYQWLTLQRRREACGTLSSTRMEKLRSVGVDFRPWKVVFRDRFEALRTFYREHGHYQVPERSGLRIWIAQFRARRCTLSKTNLRDLDSIGFPWDQ